MPEVFNYPMTYPAWWMDYYFYITWFLSMSFFSLGWAIFYRYGRFTYAINLGCFWKTSLLLLLTTVSLGAPSYYNTRFDGEHGKDGDSIKITADKLLYLDRKGNEKQLPLAHVISIYQEIVTYNPPPKIYIVAAKASVRDSVFVTTALPGYKRFLSDLSTRTGVAAKLR
ncbi:MAG: hypothetical protein FDX18_06190 [Chlorobium sp.]|nr:MAG: hypothetical protein FDX18_06190 [Chlorobium sp.]